MFLFEFRRDWKGGRGSVRGRFAALEVSNAEGIFLSLIGIVNK